MVMTNNRCVVLVPYRDFIERRCELALQDLEREGYVVRRVPGSAQIDSTRSRLATQALHDGFDELMWIDSDIVFTTADVARLRGHELPVVCGICPKKGTRAVACHVLPGTTELVFGKRGGLQPVRYAGTGFLLTRAHVYHDIAEKVGLPVCNERFGEPLVPYFIPMTIPDGEGHWYLADDFAFSERARQAGYDIMADTTIRLTHVGAYDYQWEDTGVTMSRYGTFTLRLT